WAASENAAEGLPLKRRAASSADVYDPIHNRWTAADNMSEASENVLAVTLRDGSVLLAGQFNSDPDMLPQQALATAESYARQDPSFTSFDFPGAVSTEAVGINPRGDIVGYYDSADGIRHGYLLSRETFTSIDFPGAIRTFAFAVNPRDDTVGSYNSANGRTHGFLLSGGEFTSIDVPGATFTQATGINPRGDIVGQYVTGGETHGFLLRGGEFTSI